MIATLTRTIETVDAQVDMNTIIDLKKEGESYTLRFALLAAGSVA